MATGCHHDASSCSTTASDRSDRKRKSNVSSEADVEFKPYECRFCPMKFTKSQALGGHMNRHRQEREREQVMNARHLIMQQEFSSSYMVSDQNATSFSKLGHSHLERSRRDNLLRGLHIGPTPIVGSMGSRGFVQSNPLNNPPLGPPASMPWSLGTSLETSSSSISPVNCERMVRPYQAYQMYSNSSGMNNNTSSFVMQPSYKSVIGQHNLMSTSSTPYDNATQLSMYSSTLDNSSLYQSGNNDLPQLSESRQLTHEESILTGSPCESMGLVPLTNKSTAHQQQNGVKFGHQFSQALAGSNVNSASSGFQLIPFPVTKEDGRPSLSFENTRQFNPSSTPQMDSTLSPWINQGGPSLSIPSIAHKEYDHGELEIADTRVDQASLISPLNGKVKTLKWDLSFTAHEDVETGNKITNLPPLGNSVSSFEDDFSQTTDGFDDEHPNR
ncbi:hypothetical protein KP509_39G025200 [Ceratopteris richardii]|uniref:C2H2-type domain-containing protein n=1 Tax=Ceratopteris richardii TaxID=49495 RepID=A0A8T2PZN4_CERRI|nr:hypothetical protein KP509_39G025200 [Ceratopteris richardii]